MIKLISRYRFFHTLNIILSFAITILLSSCSSIQVTKTDIPNTDDKMQAWANYRIQLQQLDSWRTSGVIGVIINQKGQSANFLWRQDNKDFWLQVYGPLGIGASTFEGDQNAVTLKQSNGNTLKAKTLQSLMQRQLGWSIPLNGLYYWIKGLPAPNTPFDQRLNKQGLSEYIYQDVWHIEYKYYSLYSNKYPLASRITLTYGKQIKIKVVIKQWIPL